MNKRQMHDARRVIKFQDRMQAINFAYDNLPAEQKENIKAQALAIVRMLKTKHPDCKIGFNGALEVLYATGRLMVEQPIIEAQLLGGIHA